MNKHVCHISYNHNAFDDRIYWKELITLKDAGYDCTHICIGEENKEFISAEGIKIIMINGQQDSGIIWLRRLSFFLFNKSPKVKAILKKAIEVKANIYHYHDLQLNALAKLLKKLLWSPVVVYDCHEAYHLLLLEGKKANIFKKLLVETVSRWEIHHAQNCDYIITTDNYTREYFTRKIPSVPCSIIYNYSYFINNTYHKKDNPFTFIYTGLMNKERGLFEMANLVLQLKDTFPDVKLLLVGSFENDKIEKEFFNFIELKDLKDHIHIHNQVAFTEIHNYYKISKIGLGLFHQTPKYKTFIPIKLFEYMAFGLPVIFSNHGPSSNIIRKENCGLLVEVNNSVSIKNVALQLLTNESLFLQQSQNGKNAVVSEYSWEREKPKLINIYHHLLNG